MAKTKVPKRIAGVKLPKRMRKKIGKTTDVLQQPIVAELVAAALIAAAGAIRDNKKVRSAAKTAKNKAGDAAQGLGSGMSSLATIVAARALEGAEHLAESQRSASANGNGSAPAKAAKRKSGKKASKK